METVYYMILDLGIIGKTEGFLNTYLYDIGRGWVVDNNNILSDRIMGYDDTEPEDSPYRIGNSDMMDQVKAISEEEAMRLIAAM